MNTELKKNIEKNLREYPYWIISLGLPGLGSATRWDVVKDKPVFKNSQVENAAILDEIREYKVGAIEKVMINLDKKSKELIEKWYFQDTYSREELLSEMNIDKGEFYRLRDKALKKFGIALGYI